MWEVSKLPIGFLPCKEYFPCNEELEQLMTQDAALYEPYREVMCHFYICLDAHHMPGPLMD